jgi:hypothetical protein
MDDLPLTNAIKSSSFGCVKVLIEAMRKLNILQQCIVAKNKVFFLLQAMFLAS